MSFRDLRNFTEMMRALGYTRLISMENFRTPNFALVAEVLIWLVRRYDPSADLPTDTDSEQDRIIFIKSVAQFMATKAHIKLNTKKLYQADGYAVKELLKVTSVLYNAMKSGVTKFDDSSDDSSPITFDISARIGDLKEARKLASDITSKGASLYDLLGKEVDLRESRSIVIARNLEITEVERGLRNSVKAVEVEIKKTLASIDNVASDEANLEAKTEKKKEELERNQKRLSVVQSVRPPYMDEYEKLEEDLQKVYDEYMAKFRNQSYLEQQLEEVNRTEQDKAEDIDMHLKKLADKIRTEEHKQNQMGAAADSDEGDEFGLDGGEDSDDAVGQQNRERPVHHRQRPNAAAGQPQQNVKGTMGMDLDDEDDDDEDDDDDDDEEDDDDEDIGDSEIDIDDDDDDDDSDDVQMGGAQPPIGGVAGKPRRNQPPPEDDDDDDDDF